MKLALYTVCYFLFFSSNFAQDFLIQHPYTQPLEGPNWNEVQSISRNTLIAVGDAGIVMISDNYGQSWVTGNVGYEDDLTQIQFLTPEIGFVAGKNIYKTRDGGESWERIILTFFGNQSMFFLTEDIGYVGGDVAIYKTIDGGSHWQKVRENENEHINSIFFVDDKIGYATLQYLVKISWQVGYWYSRIVKTEDGGQTWKDLSTGYILKEKYTGNLFLDENTGLVCTDQGKIFSTSDGGESWSLTIPFKSASYSGIHFIDSENGYVFSGRVITQTTDGGITWSSQEVINQSIETPVSSFGFVNRSQWIGIGPDGLIISTPDGGMTWQGLYGRLSDDLSNIDFVSENVGFVVSGIRRNWGSTLLILVMKTEDGGKSWRYYTIQEPTEIFDICFVDENVGYIAGSYGYLAKTTDGGKSWSKYDYNAYHDITGIQFIDKHFGFACGLRWGTHKYGTILITSDGGNNWRRIDPGIDAGLDDIQFVNQQVGYAVGSKEYKAGTVIKSIDGGVNWTELNLEIECIGLKSCSFVDSETGFICGESKVLKTTNGGLSWADISPDKAMTYKKIEFVNKNKGYLAGSTRGNMGKILYTNNAGEDWQEMEYNTDAEINDFSFINDYSGWACGNGGIIMKRDFNTSNPAYSEKKAMIRLFPNPASDKIRIDIIGFQGPYTVRLLNSSGSVCLKKEFNSNNSQLKLHNLASGLYYLSVFSEHTQYVHSKMLIVRK